MTQRCQWHRWVMPQRCHWHGWVKTWQCHWHRWVKTQRCNWHRWVKAQRSNWHRWVKTQQCHWHCWVSEDTAESILEFLKALIFFKRQSNKIQARVNFPTLCLWGKNLKNGGCLRKFFWLSGVNDECYAWMWCIKKCVLCTVYIMWCPIVRAVYRVL